MHRSSPTLLSVLLLITANTCNGFSNLRHVAYENASAISAVSAFGFLGPFRENSLAPRQTGCTAGPGGPTCSATTCCGTGQICCSNACCASSDNCFGPDKCCSKDAQTCGGKLCCPAGAICCGQSPTGCCVSGGECCTGSQTNPCCGPSESCCGDTCCKNDEVCELGECISKDIVNSGRIIRFKLDWPKNGLLLRNICNGMQGKNTATLTYSGQLSRSAKAAKRRAAGCVSGYCRSMINKGTITSDLDSCDEFPPASSNEGGDALPANDRAISCIPGFQNCIQGAMFRSMYQRTGIKAGQQFVISINCEEVLNSTVKRGLTDDSFYEPKRIILKTRDTINVTGTTNLNDTFNLSNNGAAYVFAPFGDLDPGTYTAQAQVVSGSTTNSVVIANEGDAYTHEFQGIISGQTLQFTFSLEDSDIGVGIAFSALNNTVIEWTLQGTSSSGTQTASSKASATGGLPSNALSIAPSSMQWWEVVVGIIVLQVLS